MSKKTETRLSNLLKSAQKGDKSSLDILCRELENHLHGFFRKKFENQAIVDDLAQEAYLRLLRSLPKIREPEKLRGFVTKIAIHVSQDYLRQKYRKKEEEFESYIDSADEQFKKHDKTTEAFDSTEKILNNIDIHRALDLVSEKSRHILLLKINGYKYEEIAEKVGLSVSGVKMQVQRAILQLKNNLSQM